MNRQELIEQLTQDILAYVMHGTFPEHELARKLKLEGLDERFEEYALLLDLHFVLREDVREFVEALPRWLRSIRTESQTVSQTHRGEIRGRINWNATVQTRYARNPHDRSLFVCDDHASRYDIAENLVLKALLGVIHSTLQQANDYLQRDYQWVRDTWYGNERLIEDLQHVVERNVHVLRIREPTVAEPTDRMLDQASAARQPVYREAADLFAQRQNLHRGEPGAIQTLIEQTAITPDDMGTLFELYVLFRMVGTLEHLLDAQPVFRTIASDSQELVRMESDPEVVLYHDNSAADRDLSFRAEVKDPDDQSRSDLVQEEALSLAQRYFKNPDLRNHTGRPDVLILEVRSDDDRDYRYLITEVKFSSTEKVVRQGMKETLEYLAFLKVDDEYVFEEEEADSIFGEGWNGLLVTKDLEVETQTFEEQIASENPIKVLQVSEIDSRLEGVLGEVITGV